MLPFIENPYFKCYNKPKKDYSERKMKEFNVEKFKIRLKDKTNKEEVEKVQRLRYLYLLKDYNPSLPAEGVDADGYDDVSDSILVIDTEKDVIAGTYRVATNDTINGHKFLTEDEYDIHELIESGERFLELGRAVVHVDYRNGFVIQLLLLAIYHYATEHNCKYYIGLCSFHGVDPSIYDHGFSFLARDYSFKKYNITACNNAFDLHFIDDDKIDILKAKEQVALKKKPKKQATKEQLKSAEEFIKALGLDKE